MEQPRRRGRPRKQAEPPEIDSDTVADGDAGREFDATPQAAASCQKCGLLMFWAADAEAPRRCRRCKAVMPNALQG